MSFDGHVQQSCMNMDDINGLAHSYTQAMMTGLLFITQPASATIMGLGAGSMAKNLLSNFPGMDIHSVEYREAVVDIAKKYFYLPESERLTIHIDDAVSFMESNKTKSDIIFSDLYNTQGMESRQIHHEYLKNCKNALNENGVLVLNIWYSAIKSHADLKALLSIEFKNRLLSFKVESGNTIVLAFKNSIPNITRKELLDRGKMLQEKMNIPLERYAKLLWSMQR